MVFFDNLESTEEYLLTTVDGGGGGFRAQVIATFNNTLPGYFPPINLSDLSNDFGYTLDVEDGSTPQYYLTLIQQALSQLGISLPPC